MRRNVTIFSSQISLVERNCLHSQKLKGSRGRALSRYLKDELNKDTGMKLIMMPSA